jgi:hypothetical protein
MSRFINLDGVPADAFASAIAEQGKQYGLYMFHGTGDGKWGAHFIAKPGSHRDTIILRSIPPGTYQVEWIDPASGDARGKDSISSAGGDLSLATPAYALDIALRIWRVQQ